MKVNKANVFGVVGIAAAAGILIYSTVKSYKDKQEVKKAIEEEKIDEAMVEKIKEVSDPNFSDSDLERSTCSEVLKGYRDQVLNAQNINEMRTAYMNFNVAYRDMKSGKSGIYFRCSNYLKDIRKANEKNEDNSVGDLVEVVLKVTETGVSMLSKGGGQK